MLANRLRNHFRQRNAKPAGAPDLMDALEDPGGRLSRVWDREHDEHVARQVMRRAEPDFTPATWRAFRRQVVDGLPAAAVAAELGLSVNAVLVAKSRVLKRLREEAAGLV